MLFCNMFLIEKNFNDISFNEEQAWSIALEVYLGSKEFLVHRYFMSFITVS